jgi:hypothetical protein
LRKPFYILPLIKGEDKGGANLTGENHSDLLLQKLCEHIELPRLLAWGHPFGISRGKLTTKVIIGFSLINFWLKPQKLLAYSPRAKARGNAVQFLQWFQAFSIVNSTYVRWILSKKKFTVLILFLVFLFSNKVYSQEFTNPLVTDRPDQTESAVTVPLHSTQIETGFTFESFKEKVFVYGDIREKNISVENYSIAGTLLRYGLEDNVEFRLGGGYLVQKSDDTYVDFDDIIVGLKINFFQEGSAPLDFGVLAHLIIPVYPLFSLREIEPELIFAISRSISERFSVSANFGGSLDHQYVEIIYLYTLALGISLSDELGSFIEIYGNANESLTPVHNFDGGFTYLLSDNLQLDLSGGKGISGTDSFWFVSTGVSLRLPK